MTNSVLVHSGSHSKNGQPSSLVCISYKDGLMERREVRQNEKGVTKEMHRDKKTE